MAYGVILEGRGLLRGGIKEFFEFPSKSDFHEFYSNPLNQSGYDILSLDAQRSDFERLINASLEDCPVITAFY